MLQVSKSIPWLGAGERVSYSHLQQSPVSLLHPSVCVTKFPLLHSHIPVFSVGPWLMRMGCFFDGEKEWE